MFSNADQQWWDNFVAPIGQWFLENIPRYNLPSVTLTAAQYDEGDRNLPDAYARLILVMRRIWIPERRLRPTENMVCKALFDAMRQLGILTVIYDE